MKRRGFTLVELMIVVVILGILAAIVVPQFTEASSDAQQNSLTSNLRVIRGQIELYKMQHLSTYPPEAEAAFKTAMTTKTKPDGTAGGTLGPYLQAVPNNPFTGDSTIAKTAAGTSAWYYEQATGTFRANDTAAHGAL